MNIGVILDPKTLDSRFPEAPGTFNLADLMEYNHPDEIPGLMAGGIGKTPPGGTVSQGSDVFGDDYRVIEGKMKITRLTMNGKTTGVRFQTDLTFTVGDTIDFCPGNLSSGTESLGTIPSAFLEANGIAHDVGFETTFRTNPKEWTFTAIPPDWDKTDKEPPSTCNGARAVVARHFPSQGPVCEPDDDAVPTVNPRDPNDIVGPTGFGDDAWLLPDASLPTPPEVDDVETIRDARGKKITQIIVEFDEAIDVTAAETIVNYGLVSQKGRKIKPVPLAAALWDGDTLEVTLTPVKPLAVKKLPTYALTVFGTGTLADTAGNGFDGDGDGTPGGDFVLPLAQATARATARRATLAAVDVLLDSDQASASLIVADSSINRFLAEVDLMRREDSGPASWIGD